MSQIDMKELYATINAKTLRRMELYDSILIVVIVVSYIILVCKGHIVFIKYLNLL